MLFRCKERLDMCDQEIVIFTSKFKTDLLSKDGQSITSFGKRL